MINQVLGRRLGWGMTLAGLLLCSSGCSSDSKIQGHLERADRYYDSGQVEESRIEYMNVLKLAPENVHALRRLGTIYLDKGEISTAVVLLTRVKEADKEDLATRLKLATLQRSSQMYDPAWDEAIYVLDKAPTNEEAIVLLTSVAITSNKIAQAEQRLEQFRQSVGEKTPYHRALGLLRVRQQDFAGAQAALLKAVEISPESSQVLSELAELYWVTGNLEEADASFKKAAQLSSKLSSIWLQWAEFKFKNDDLKGAREILEQTIKEKSDWVPALVLLAQVAFAERRLEETSALVKQVLEKNPSDVHTRLLQARLRLAEKQPVQAIQDLEALNTQLNERVPQVLYHLALAYSQTNAISRALNCTEKALLLDPNYTEALVFQAKLNLGRGDLTAVITSLQALLAKRPKLIEARLLLAEAYQAQGKPEQTLTLCQALETDVPASARVQLLKGTALLALQKTDDAQAAFLKALELEPNHLQALSQLTRLDIERHEHARAADRVRASIEKAPANTQLQYLLAHVLLAQGETNQAETTLLRIIETDANYSEAYSELASIYLSLGRIDQALEKVNSALARNPKDLRALSFQGGIFMDMKKYDQAAAAFEAMLELQPAMPPIQNNLAYLYAEHLNKPDLAQTLAEKARQAQPTNAIYADTLGWILYKRGNYTRAVGLLTEAAAGATHYAEIHYHLGLAHYMMAQEEPARAAFQKALDLANTQEFPGRSELPDYLAVLQINLTKPDEAITALQKQLAQKPTDFLAHVRLGKALEQKGDLAKAIQAYEGAVAIHRQAPLVLDALARLYCIYPPDKAKAFEYAKDAQKLDPNNPVILQRLGRLASDTGDPEWALSLLQESARRQPQNPETQFDLARVSYRLGQLTASEAALQKVLQLNPTQPQLDQAKLFLDLLTLYKNRNSLSNAAPQIRTVLDKEPDNLPALILLALLQQTKGNRAEAEKIYTDILQKNPQFPLAQKHLAALQANQPDRRNEALQIALQARTRLPADPELAKILGCIYYAQAEYDQAQLRLSESARILASDPEVLFYLGMTQYKLKDNAASKANLQRALSFNLDEQLSQEAKQVLSELN